MKDVLVIIFIELFASSSIAQFIMDYRKERLFMASLKLVTVILMLTMGICFVWQRTLEII